MKNSIAGKVIVITGASRGIGKALAVSFAKENAKLAVCARNTEMLNGVIRELQIIGADVEYETVDVGNKTEVNTFAKKVVTAYGRVDALINNAAILGKLLPIAELPTKIWENVLQVNLTGLFYMTQAFLPLMMAQRNGSIINMSSSAGVVGKAEKAAYGVSKFGVEGFSQILADELIRYNIRVNVIDPGPVDTDMRREAVKNEDRSKLKSAEDIYKVIRFMISDYSVGINDTRIKIQNFQNQGD